MVLLSGSDFIVRCSIEKFAKVNQSVDNVTISILWMPLTHQEMKLTVVGLFEGDSVGLSREMALTHVE